jgi:hypothetical protein
MVIVLDFKFCVFPLMSHPRLNYIYIDIGNNYSGVCNASHQRLLYTFTDNCNNYSGVCNARRADIQQDVLDLLDAIEC